MSTEDRNPRTVDIDRWPTDRVVDALLAEDSAAVDAARAAGPALAEAVERTLTRLAEGGRVHYFGAGASGRLAVLDATETTPTFGVPPGLFTPHLPGGAEAFTDSGIDFEDAAAAGHDDAAAVGGGDVAVGVTASGSTPYVAGALTVLVTSTVDAAVAADVRAVAATGPEAESAAALAEAGGDVPFALVHVLSGRPLEECRAALGAGGMRAALGRLAGNAG